MLVYYTLLYYILGGQPADPDEDGERAVRDHDRPHGRRARHAHEGAGEETTTNIQTQ